MCYHKKSRATHVVRETLVDTSVTISEMGLVKPFPYLLPKVATRLKQATVSPEADAETVRRWAGI